MLYAPSVPLPRVIFPALVGTTTASRNALRLASPAARMPPRPRGRRRDDAAPPPSPRAMYSQYTHARTHARTLTRAHTWPFAPARACACRTSRMAESRFAVGQGLRNGLVRAHSARKHAATRRRPLSQARNATGDDPTITRRSFRIEITRRRGSSGVAAFTRVRFRDQAEGFGSVRVRERHALTAKRNPIAKAVNARCNSTRRVGARASYVIIRPFRRIAWSDRWESKTNAEIHREIDRARVRTHVSLSPYDNCNDLTCDNFHFESLFLCLFSPCFLRRQETRGITRWRRNVLLDGGLI